MVTVLLFTTNRRSKTFVGTSLSVNIILLVLTSLFNGRPIKLNQRPWIEVLVDFSS